MSSVVPEGWISSQLGSLGVFSKGKGISKKETLPDGIPCIRYAEIYTVYDFRIKTFKSFISPITAKTSKKLTKNDIIFAGSGETVEDIGKSVAFTLDCDAYVGGDSIVLSPSSDLDSTFLSYQLNDNIRRSQLRKLGQGSSVIHIYSSGLQEVILSLPPLPEQKKIASILTSVDEVIENTQKQIDKLQDLKKATMNELLTKGIGHTEFKDSELGRIPESWECKKLGEVGKCLGGFAFKSQDASSEGTPWLKIANVGVGVVKWNDRSFLPKTFSGKHPNFILRQGDIVCAMTRPILNGKLKVATISESDAGALLNQRVCKITPYGKVVDDFLFHLLQSDFIVEQIDIEIAGSDPPNVSGEQIESVWVTVPSIEEQRNYAEVIDSIQNRINILSLQLSQTQSLKKSLMQDLLTGKVRVTVN